MPIAVAGEEGAWQRRPVTAGPLVPPVPVGELTGGQLREDAVAPVLDRVRAEAEELRLPMLGEQRRRGPPRLTQRVEGHAPSLKGAAASADDRSVRRTAQLQDDTREGT